MCYTQNHRTTTTAKLDANHHSGLVRPLPTIWKFDVKLCRQLISVRWLSSHWQHKLHNPMCCQVWNSTEAGEPSSTTIRVSKFSGCRRLSVKPCAKVSKCLTYAHMRHCRTSRTRMSCPSCSFGCCYFGVAISSDSVDNNDNNKRPAPRDLLALWLGEGSCESERLSSQSCVLWVITWNGLLTR